MLLLAHVWPGLAGAALLGLLVGRLAGWPARPLVPLVLCAAAALLAATAAAGLVPGVAGLWLESAGLILPAYLAGCALGAAARRSSASAKAARPGLDPPPSAGEGGPRSGSGEGQREAAGFGPRRAPSGTGAPSPDPR